ncbi:GntR family transcriptional regulator [Lysinibacter cavernae]|uniref:DNA-binding transcriptional regulator YhcF (GntR family) n=1 Tax=Lysinibacter cavernae TaxID=1640652 RepID=A0A7X5R0E6_9MICO|nr:GntR family transcriptional regulator [Lysinibacter cavernae]NIH53311.1 DNA-binding transcriptional regulator YhcF (GntR family) [Lysinibacter cavernae]
MLHEELPLFQQIAEQIAERILNGSYPEESQVPSKNELAAFYRINPTTAANGVNMLAEQGILYKKRGIGMFVSPGAQDLLRAQRRSGFTQQYVTPMLHEAKNLGIQVPELLSLISKEASHDQ